MGATSTVDGSFEIRRENQLRLVVHPILYEVLAPSPLVIAGFQPSTVVKVDPSLIQRWIHLQ